MTRQGQGFRDKLYWRRLRRGEVWHCFKRMSGGGYGALCDRAGIPNGELGGQECRRPKPVLRCGFCDGKEMTRRGWDKSGPTLHPKKPASSVTVRKGKKGTSITFKGNAARGIFKAMGGKL